MAAVALELGADEAVVVGEELRPAMVAEVGGALGRGCALLTTSRRTATVTATTPLRCFVLTGRDFRRVLDENRSVERKVMQALAERVLSYAGDPAL